ncbi:MAG: hypothetical protein K2X66_16295 [Cyanobacteria bacterium]|nr:hypothetical protein [Cyanobacteriota bacterium]
MSLIQSPLLKAPSYTSLSKASFQFGAATSSSSTTPGEDKPAISSADPLSTGPNWLVEKGKDLLKKGKNYIYVSLASLVIGFGFGNGCASSTPKATTQTPEPSLAVPADVDAQIEKHAAQVKQLKAKKLELLQKQIEELKKNP